MTLGESRVRLSFNPSANQDVEDIKRRASECIDWCNDRVDEQISDPEVKRLYALAMTHFEDAAMWAVKAATAEKVNAEGSIPKEEKISS